MARTMLAGLASALLASAAFGQATVAQPHIGYLYPAGGQRGTTVDVLVGGQNLRALQDVYVTGGGVKATVVRYHGRPPRLQREERIELIKRLIEIKERRPELVLAGISAQMPAARAAAKAAPKEPAAKAVVAKASGDGDTMEMEAAAEPEPVQLPNNPMLAALDDLTDRELELLVANFLTRNDRKQQNNQIGETALIRVEIASSAAPGDRELRLRTRTGLTNPMCFQVGNLPEVIEQATVDPEKPRQAPVLVNGQIMPGEVDRWRLRLSAGQKIVIQVDARRLVPFLADAVPGWIQATAALYDSSGRQVAYEDDYRYDPDPVLMYEAAETGEYVLEIKDSIFRGREDFVYRASVSQGPFVESMYPLGGRPGARALATVEGWNIGTRNMPLDTSSGGTAVRETEVVAGGKTSNTVTYAVDDLPETNEVEPNSDAGSARMVTLPQTVNGRIGRAGDTDAFLFRGRAGEEVVLEVKARRLGSPLDSVVRLLDSSGRAVAFNDDCAQKNGVLYTDVGVLTHQSDSYIRTKLPADGMYCAQIADAAGHGGREYAYRLRISAPRPDFELAVTPSSVNAVAGSAAVMTVYAQRQDGFDGAIELGLVQAPAGVVVDGGLIPPGTNSVRVTLTVPANAPREPFAVVLAGRAVVAGQTVMRAAVPCEDMMQAFLWRHLVPSRELVVAVAGARARLAPPEVTGRTLVPILPGTTAEVTIAMQKRPNLDSIELALSDAPAGVTLADKSVGTDSIVLKLNADPAMAKIGTRGNIIVEAWTQVEVEREGKKTGQKARVPLGTLPAIPFEIVDKLDSASRAPVNAAWNATIESRPETTAPARNRGRRSRTTSSRRGNQP